MRTAAVFLLAASAFAQTPVPNPELAAFVATDWKRVDHVRDLPKGLKVSTVLSRMADPGERFTVGCEPERRFRFFGPELPRKRLIFGGKTSDRVFVYYEHGGLVLGSSVSIFMIDRNGRYNQIADLLAPRKVTSIEALKQACREGQLSPMGRSPR
ncbi:MAG TPA: hypothetical protein VJ600_07765 [Holophagaceae bacterium]|nr:hypothetical protein [Holophagaceae bacterium]